MFPVRQFDNIQAVQSSLNSFVLFALICFVCTNLFLQFLNCSLNIYVPNHIFYIISKVQVCHNDRQTCSLNVSFSHVQNKYHGHLLISNYDYDCQGSSWLVKMAK